MKKHVNLILQRQASSSLAEKLKKIRSFAIILSMVLAVVIIVELVFVVFLQRNITTLENNKKVSLQYLSRNKALEQKIEFFLFKYNLLKEYLQDDAEVYTYYNLLVNLLDTIEVNAQLMQFSMESSKVATFSLQFDTYQDATAFVDLAETPLFLNYFETLTLNNFAFSDQSTSYELSLVGQFKPIQQ